MINVFYYVVDILFEIVGNCFDGVGVLKELITAFVDLFKIVSEAAL